MRTAHYSGYLNGVAGLMGIPVAGLTTDETSFLSGYFTRAIRKIWESNNWLDVCPYAEARFPNNLVDFTNDYTQPIWGLSAATITTSANIQNPLDIRVNCQQVLETAATSNHGVTQSMVFVPSLAYSFSFYVRGYGRQFIYCSVNDGTTSFTGFYNVASGTVGTTTNGATTGISSVGSGFYLCTINFTSTATARAGSIVIDTSPDGSTLSFAGNILNGMYLWGVSGGLVQVPSPSSYYISLTQDGETAIDAVFNVWGTNPTGNLPGFGAGYQLTQYGIQLIGSSALSPVYIYYRQQRPTYSGSTWSALTTYAAGTIVYYTSVITGESDYYTCLVGNSNQTPDTATSFWAVNAVPYIFLSYCIWMGYGDWLAQDGQADKAAAAYAMADDFKNDESDKQERQQGFVQPWKVQTHLTSQNRGIGFGGQSNQPNFFSGQGYGY